MTHDELIKHYPVEYFFAHTGARFSAYSQAEEFLRLNGFSFGTMERGFPIAIKYGPHDLPKWKHFNQSQHANFDGIMIGSAEGDVYVHLKQSTVDYTNDRVPKCSL